MATSIVDVELADSAVMTVKTARGDEDQLINGKPVLIEFFSPGTPQGVKALHVAKRANDLRTFRAFRNEFPHDDAAKAAQEQANKLTAFTKSISDNVGVAPHSIWSNPKLPHWVRQAEEFIAQHGNFTKELSTE